VTAEGSAPRGRGFAGWIALAAALVLVLATAAYLYSPGQGELPGFERADGALFPELAARVDEAVRIVLERGERRTILERSGEGWHIAEKDGYPARGAEVAELIDTLAALEALYVSSRASPPYARYGLEPEAGPTAGVRVSVEAADRTPLARAVIGHTYSTPRGSRRTSVYVRQADDERVWLADGALQPSADPLEWLDPRLAHVARERVHEVVTVSRGGDRLAVRREPGGELSLDASVEGEEPIELEAVVAPLLAALEHLTFEDVRAAGTLEGHTDGEGAEAVFRTFDGLVLRFSLVDSGDETWVLLDVDVAEPVAGRQADGTGASPGASESVAEVRRAAERLRRETAGWAYRLGNYSLAQLTTGPDQILFTPG